MSGTELFALTRGGVEEIVVHGEVAVVHGNDFTLRSSGAERVFPVRSLLKPFQFLAAKIPDEKWVHSTDRKRFTACLGSTSATDSQVEQLRQWYASSEMQELVHALVVPPSFPMDEVHRVHLKTSGKSPSPIFHTCFSKHMGILQGCVANGWPIEQYHSTAHPFHQHLLQVLAFVLGQPTEAIPVVTDGCFLPSPVLRFPQLAQLYGVLASSNEPKIKAIREMMMTNPEWVGGPKRVDTRLMQENPGVLVAKEGADGLLTVGVLPTTRFPKGLGIAIKIYAGFYPGLFALALNPLAKKFGFNSVGEVPRGQEIHYQNSLA